VVTKTTGVQPGGKLTSQETVGAQQMRGLVPRVRVSRDARTNAASFNLALPRRHVAMATPDRSFLPQRPRQLLSPPLLARRQIRLVMLVLDC